MTSEAVAIQGQVDPRFARVREAFERSFRDLGDVGASLSVLVDGEMFIWHGVRMLQAAEYCRTLVPELIDAAS